MDPLTQKAVDKLNRKIDELEAEQARIEAEWSAKANTFKEEQQRKLLIEQKAKSELRKAQKAADKQFHDKVTQSVMVDEQVMLEAHAFKFNVALGLGHPTSRRVTWMVLGQDLGDPLVAKDIVSHYIELLDVAKMLKWQGCTDEECILCVRWCVQAVVMMIQGLLTTGSLEIPVSILNNLVLQAYDEWETNFPHTAMNMYSILLDKITKTSPALGAAFEPQQYLDKAADILGLSSSKLDHLKLPDVWVVGQRYVKFFEELSGNPYWRKKEDGDREIEAVRRTRQSFDINNMLN